MDNSHKVDTLSIWERLSVRTNIPDWVLTVPNVGVEFDIRNTNWNRWSAGVNIRWRPKGQNNIVKPFVFDLFEVTLEGREYWRERRATAHGYLSPHSSWLDKLFSCRTKSPSHPSWIFYRGGYVGFSKYSTMFGNEGQQGTAYMAGVTWGFVKPFIAFGNGNSLDFELGISAGAIMTSYDTYSKDEYNNCYPKTGHVNNKILPMVRDIHAAVVYRFGKYPIQKKYRWRYDVDLAFQARKDSMYNRFLMLRDQKYVNDSIYNVVSSEFRILYDSCVIVRHAEDQERIDRKAPQRLVVTDKRRQEDSLIYARQEREKSKGESLKSRVELRERQRQARKRAKQEAKYARELEEAKERIQKLDAIKE